MNTIVCETKINGAVKTICAEIWGDFSRLETTQSPEQLSESFLWEELVSCILSSQVKYEHSSAACKVLKQKNLLCVNSKLNNYEKRLSSCLKKPIRIEEKYFRYRFPNKKAQQISAAYRNIYGDGSTLTKLLNSRKLSSEVRELLVDTVPGFGMKQASMYLRNVRLSYDLAIIDTHILKYLMLVRAIQTIPKTISKKRYLQNEKILLLLAQKFGYPVGCVDYAIWVVMRVANREGYI